jgi:predicted nuclease of predicted toxin-antitoxin system
MRILLDECLPRRLKHELPEHEVRTVAEMGWSGLKNGALLSRVAGFFDVFLTIDRGLVHQQRLQGIPFAILMLAARSNDIDTLRPLMPEAREALARIQPGEVIRVGSARAR